VKTISVKEAAEALGVSTRAVQYKLQNGDLKGTRSKNQYGVAEWRVWPNKEISEALSQKQGIKSEESADAINFSPNESETIEAEEVAYNEGEEVFDEPSNWRQVEMERLEVMAEKLVKPLAERLEAQAVALREQEKIIEDQQRQLRLLPDLQKQAETERKAAEIGLLENEALKKQITALEEAKVEKVDSLQAQVNSLTEELQKLQQPWWKKLFGTVD
jgi:septal ring factor EnvC (AmiA/AmiB activator)